MRGVPGSVLGEFAVIFLKQIADIEIICGGLVPLASALFNLNAVEIRFFVFLVLCYGVLEINDVVLVARVYHIPCVLLVGSGARRYDGLQQMVQTVLPDACEVYLSACPQGIDEEVHLRQVEGIVGERLLGVCYDGVKLGTCMSLLVVEAFIFGGDLGMPLWVEILLEQISVVKMAVVVEIHHSLVFLIPFHQFRVIVG